MLTARVDAAMKAVALFHSEFADLSSFHPCVLVFEPSREWIFQCPGLVKSPGFEVTHAEVGGTPVITAPTLTLPGQTVPFEKVKMIVGRAGGSIPLPTGGSLTPAPNRAFPGTVVECRPWLVRPPPTAFASRWRCSAKGSS